MTDPRPRSLPTTIVIGLVAGGVGTFVKSKAEGFLQPRAEQVWPPTPAEKEIPGADGSDHPLKMPPAEIAAAVLPRFGRPADDDSVMQAAGIIHWVMGVGSGVAYALVARRFPAAQFGFGVPAGLALYAGTHGSTLPAMKLQPFPWAMPKAAIGWEAGSHAVYGAAVDLVLRAVKALPLPRSPR